MKNLLILFQPPANFLVIFQAHKKTNFSPEVRIPEEETIEIISLTPWLMPALPPSPLPSTVVLSHSWRLTPIPESKPNLTLNKGHFLLSQ